MSLLEVEFSQTIPPAIASDTSEAGRVSEEVWPGRRWEGGRSAVGWCRDERIRMEWRGRDGEETPEGWEIQR
eukprot:344807-Hanusia_phi.AAC.23